MSVLAFELAATVRHDGQGGVADGLESSAGVEEWLRRNSPLVADLLGRPFDPSLIFGAGEAGEPLRELRRAVRSLFARAVSPAPPSKADANTLLEPSTALRLLNEAADELGTTHLDWPQTGEPVTRWSGRSSEPLALLLGAIGRSGIDFLTGPDRQRLRACPAARCVKYFLQDDPRQTWCSPSCGNRERVNRYYQRKHITA
ncbi:CGNR zinc finger domain-containing protein [Kribbella sancticallisti]|uniref:CGNR zinc finger domain-containing protein n=1 Tax=Kribbella sancticallisti TaxID=460087 RepID=A0ABN2ELF5_9ACTN